MLSFTQPFLTNSFSKIKTTIRDIIDNTNWDAVIESLVMGRPGSGNLAKDIAEDIVSLFSYFAPTPEPEQVQNLGAEMHQDPQCDEYLVYPL